MKSRDPRFDSVRDAKYILSVVESYQRNYAHPMSRVCSNVIDNEAEINNILSEIAKSDKPESQKYAAAKLFKLEHALNAEYITMQQQYKVLLDSLRDPKLGCKHTSLMFGIYCSHSWIRHPSQKNLLALKLFPQHSSPQWRETVAAIQQICFDKLTAEVKALTNPEDKIALLQLALDKMHAFFWKEKSATSNDATGTESYRKLIQLELDAIKLESDNKSALKA